MTKYIVILRYRQVVSIEIERAWGIVGVTRRVTVIKVQLVKASPFL